MFNHYGFREVSTLDGRLTQGRMKYSGSRAKILNMLCKEVCRVAGEKFKYVVHTDKDRKGNYVTILHLEFPTHSERTSIYWDAWRVIKSRMDVVSKEMKMNEAKAEADKLSEVFALSSTIGLSFTMKTNL